MCRLYYIPKFSLPTLFDFLYDDKEWWESKELRLLTTKTDYFTRDLHYILYILCIFVYKPLDMFYYAFVSVPYLTES
jgi:hypothetical protein